MRKDDVLDYLVPHGNWPPPETRLVTPFRMVRTKLVAEIMQDPKTRRYASRKDESLKIRLFFYLKIVRSLATSSVRC
jgi:hypothetical protein